MEKLPLRVLVLHAGDDVGVMVGDGLRGASCEVESAGRKTALALATDVPFGHKVAVRDIAAGDAVRKYGQKIGVATHAIAAGSHVHVHNLDGLNAGLRGTTRETAHG